MKLMPDSCFSKEKASVAAENERLFNWSNWKEEQCFRDYEPVKMNEILLKNSKKLDFFNYL